MDSPRDLVWWRDYFDGAKVGAFEVINRATDLAISDFPSQFKVERDAIAQRIFSTYQECQRTLSLSSDEASNSVQPSGKVINDGAIDREVSKPMTAAETEEVAVNKGKAASETVTAQKSSDGAKLDGRKPIMRIRFRGKEPAVDKAEPVEDMKAISGKSMEVRKLPEESSKGQNVARKLEKGADDPTRVNGGTKLEKSLTKKTKFSDADVEAKLESAKRKLREAYDRDDLAKRSRTIQFVGDHEALTLQAKKGLSSKPLIKARQQCRKLLKGRSSVPSTKQSSTVFGF